MSTEEEENNFENVKRIEDILNQVKIMVSNPFFNLVKAE